MCCREREIGNPNLLAGLPFGHILKPLACLSCLPHPEAQLQKVQTVARMEGEANRKASERRQDALTHSALLPCYHSILL